MSTSINSNVKPIEIIIYDQGGRKVYTSKCNYDGVPPIVTNLSSISGKIYFESMKNAAIEQQKAFIFLNEYVG